MTTPPCNALRAMSRYALANSLPRGTVFTVPSLRNTHFHTCEAATGRRTESRPYYIVPIFLEIMPGKNDLLYQVRPDSPILLWRSVIPRGSCTQAEHSCGSSPAGARSEQCSFGIQVGQRGRARSATHA